MQRVRIESKVSGRRRWEAPANGSARVSRRRQSHAFARSRRRCSSLAHRRRCSLHASRDTSGQRGHCMRCGASQRLLRAGRTRYLLCVLYRIWCSEHPRTHSALQHRDTPYNNSKVTRPPWAYPFPSRRKLSDVNADPVRVQCGQFEACKRDHQPLSATVQEGGRHPATGFGAEAEQGMDEY